MHNNFLKFANSKKKKQKKQTRSSIVLAYSQDNKCFLAVLCSSETVKNNLRGITLGIRSILEINSPTKTSILHKDVDERRCMGVFNCSTLTFVRNHRLPSKQKAAVKRLPRPINKPREKRRGLQCDEWFLQLPKIHFLKPRNQQTSLDLLGLSFPCLNVSDPILPQVCIIPVPRHLLKTCSQITYI